jgi:hypothetical protein
VQVTVQALNPDNSLAGYIAFSPTPTGNTPAGFNVIVNAGNLNSGLYTGNIRISSPDTSVVNLPIDIPFSVRVLAPPPPGFNPVSPATGFFYFRCSDYFDMLDQEEPENGDNGNGENANGDNNNGEAAGVQTATLGQITIPQTVTVSFRDTPGATGSGGRVSLAVVGSPTIAAAAEGSTADGTGIPGAEPRIVDAFVDHNGDVILVDSAGGRTLVEMNHADSAAVTNHEWPSLVPWVTSVRSNQDRVPFQATLVGDLYPLIKDMEPSSYIRERAVLVVVGDDIYGPPPRNVRVVPLSIVCTNRYLSLPELNYGFDF